MKSVQGESIQQELKPCPFCGGRDALSQMVRMIYDYTKL